MSQKVLRYISLVLAVILMVSTVVPAPVGAAASAKDIEKQIIRIYNQAKIQCGRSSFDGYCATLVNAELYLMGVTDTVRGGNGNELYDAYAGQNVTDAGYHVEAYPASRYSLLEALNEITADGTRDVYDILVGFQQTNSSLGRRCGHACVIHAILDGTVYFLESYDVILNGRRYPEGAPISCSIQEFARYYESTTVSFDGVVHFTEQGYADLCRIYPTALTVSATGGALWSQPCEARTDDSAQLVRELKSGEELFVTGLYLNTEGEYWYRIGDGEGFVRASKTHFLALRYDDITVAEPTVPTVLRQGKGFQVKGDLYSQVNSIYTVRAQVYRLEEGTQSQVLSATETVERKSYALSGSQISRDLAFRKLMPGQYRYDLAVIVASHYVQSGQLQVAWETVKVWSSEFQVVEQSASSALLLFDAQGGTVALDQTAVEIGQSLGTLPVAQRQGHVFLGWFTEAGVRVDGSMTVEEDLSLYAHWISEETLYSAWYDHGQCLYYYCDGLTTMGCIQVDGMLFYFSTMDMPGQDHILWTAAGAV